MGKNIIEEIITNEDCIIIITSDDEHILRGKELEIDMDIVGCPLVTVITSYGAYYVVVLMNNITYTQAVYNRLETLMYLDIKDTVECKLHYDFDTLESVANINGAIIKRKSSLACNLNVQASSILIYTNAFVKYDDNSFHKNLNPSKISSIDVCNGLIIVGMTMVDVVLKYDEMRLKKLNSMLGTIVRACVEDVSGRVYIITDENIFIFDGVNYAD